MRAGPDTALARVVRVFGEARPHHAYLFVNRRATRLIRNAKAGDKTYRLYDENVPANLVAANCSKFYPLAPTSTGS